MKSMLITASALGVAIAGMLLYLQQKKRNEQNVKALNGSAVIGNPERPAYHAMG